MVSPNGELRKDQPSQINMQLTGYYGQGVRHIGMLNGGGITCGVTSAQQSRVKASMGHGSSEHQCRNGVKTTFKYIIRERIFRSWSGRAFGVSLVVV